MPNYFAGYDTIVAFTDAETLRREHSGLPHGGTVIRSGRTGWEGECRQTVEYQLQLESNPQFTGSVLAACARAAVRLWERGEVGCRTMLDLAPADLSLLNREEMLKHLL
jgi:diaminopimelate dehydrogenase